LSGPRLIRTAPNGDLFVAESSAGRIRVLRANGTQAAPPSTAASGLTGPTAGLIPSAMRLSRGWEDRYWRG